MWIDWALTHRHFCVWLILTLRMVGFLGCCFLCVCVFRAEGVNSSGVFCSPCKDDNDDNEEDIWGAPSCLGSKHFTRTPGDIHGVLRKANLDTHTKRKLGTAHTAFADCAHGGLLNPSTEQFLNSAFQMLIWLGTAFYVSEMRLSQQALYRLLLSDPLVLLWSIFRWLLFIFAVLCHAVNILVFFVDGANTVQSLWYSFVQMFGIVPFFRDDKSHPQISLTVTHPDFIHSPMCIGSSWDDLV